MTDAHAVLSNAGRYTVFSSGDERLTFVAPYSLVRYEDVLEWDKGYLVVLARYAHAEEPVEDYIDLVPVLRNLRMDEASFLEPIEHVVVSND